MAWLWVIESPHIINFKSWGSLGPTFGFVSFRKSENFKREILKIEEEILKKSERNPKKF